MLCEFMKIDIVEELPNDIQGLIVESQSDGFRFLARLKDDYNSGVNQFNGQGETLVTVRIDGLLVAIGGINNQNGIARLRRFYVSRKVRRLGVGRTLLNFLENYASSYFLLIVLYTDTLSASEFYEACGYSRVNGRHVSHQKTFM